MYTVIVADDEQEIRRSLIRKVDWGSVGFQVIGEAENGAEALELTEKLEPDLLLTDIRMPFISGIELARQVREIRPATQIAFLSGFDDFSYAQQAIQYNIISYLLKPISSSELEKELLKMKEKIDQKFQVFSQPGMRQEHIEKREFLTPLLLDGFGGELPEEEHRMLMKEAISCGLLDGEEPEALNYAVMVTRILDKDGKNCTTRGSVKAIDSILKKYTKYCSVYLQGRVVSLLLATPRGFDKYLHILVDDICQSVERIMGMDSVIGVSRVVEKLERCHECYLEAMSAAANYGKEEGNIHFISDDERTESFDKVQEAMKAVDFSKYKEVVFCGFGEPTEALDVLKQSAKLIKEKYNMPIRINTNGLGSLVNERDIVPELKGLVDTISVSLNTPNADEYHRLVRSKFGEKSFDAMIDFTKECTKYIPNVVMTTVETTITHEEEKQCQEICDRIGAKYRIRPWED